MVEGVHNKTRARPCPAAYNNRRGDKLQIVSIIENMAVPRAAPPDLQENPNGKQQFYANKTD
jgi:hypothetical protein